MNAGRSAQLPREWEIRVGTLADVADTEVFDSILYIDVIADVRPEFQRAVRHLRRSGFLIVLAPAHQFLFSPFDTSVAHHRRYNTGKPSGLRRGVREARISRLRGPDREFRQSISAAVRDAHAGPDSSLGSHNGAAVPMGGSFARVSCRQVHSWRVAQASIMKAATTVDVGSPSRLAQLAGIAILGCIAPVSIGRSG
jgi:hypothetical protein